MAEREQQFLAVYQRYRFADQHAFYQRRLAEFQAAHHQALTLSAWLMFFASTAAALAATHALGWPPVWTLLAVVFPILSTAIQAYDDLYAFEQQAKLYQDAANALHRVRADAPDLRPGLTKDEYRRGLAAYVEEVEDVLRKELSQWGQLRNEMKLSQQPSNFQERRAEKGVE
jgi:hypothetical protein